MRKKKLQQPNYKWLLTDHNSPLSPPPPPPTLRDSSPISYLVPYCRSVCRLAHGPTEVFPKTSFYINFWHNFVQLLPLLHFLSGMTFRTFTQHFFAKNDPFLCRTIILRNPFPRSLLLHLPFNEPVPITYSEGPCNPSGTEPLTFYEGKGDGSRIWITPGLQHSLPDQFTFNF